MEKINTSNIPKATLPAVFGALSAKSKCALALTCKALYKFYIESDSLSRFEYVIGKEKYMARNRVETELYPIYASYPYVSGNHAKSHQIESGCVRGINVVPGSTITLPAMPGEWLKLIAGHINNPLKSETVILKGYFGPKFGGLLSLSGKFNKVIVRVRGGHMLDKSGPFDYALIYSGNQLDITTSAMGNTGIGMEVLVGNPIDLDDLALLGGRNAQGTQDTQSEPVSQMVESIKISHVILPVRGKLPGVKQIIQDHSDNTLAKACKNLEHLHITWPIFNNSQILDGNPKLRSLVIDCNHRILAKFFTQFYKITHKLDNMVINCVDNLLVDGTVPTGKARTKLLVINLAVVSVRNPSQSYLCICRDLITKYFDFDHLQFNGYHGTTPAFQ